MPEDEPEVIEIDTLTALEHLSQTVEEAAAYCAKHIPGKSAAYYRKLWEECAWARLQGREQS